MLNGEKAGFSKQGAGKSGLLKQKEIRLSYPYTFWEKNPKCI